MASQQPLTYQAAGVDIELGDVCSRLMYEASRQTWGNRRGRFGEVVVDVDDFSGVRCVDLSGLDGVVMNVNADGVGTKVEVAERVGRHDTIAFDLFAMVCDDAVIRGGEPFAVSTVLDVNRLDEGIVAQLAQGMVAAAADGGVAVLNGEIAELGHRVGGRDEHAYNWSATLCWAARRERLLTGAAVKPGQAVVGLRERGLRSNGFSLARRIAVEACGENWHEASVGDASLGDLLLTPSAIYTRAVLKMIGGLSGEPACVVTGLAHITGGGIPGKLGRLLKVSGCGARLHTLPRPPAACSALLSMAAVESCEAYRTWNMGVGMAVITPEPEAAIAAARTVGIDADLIGETTDQSVIELVSQHPGDSGAVLQFQVE